MPAPKGQTARKAGRKAGTFQKGHDPRRNVTKPGPGRPPAEFKAWCIGLLDDPANRQQVEDILSDNSHPAYATMFRTIADRAHGKPQEHVEHSGSVTLEQILARSHEK